MEEEIRLQKFLAENGIASRRKCEELIEAGRVKVNGEVVTKLGTKINPSADIVEFDSKKINASKKEYTYILLNKPIDYVTTVKDQFRKKYCTRLSKNKQEISTSWKIRYVHIRCNYINR